MLPSLYGEFLYRSHCALLAWYHRKERYLKSAVRVRDGADGLTAVASALSDIGGCSCVLRGGRRANPCQQNDGNKQELKSAASHRCGSESFRLETAVVEMMRLLVSLGTLFFFPGCSAGREVTRQGAPAALGDPLEVVLFTVIYRHGDRTPVDVYPTDPYKDRSNW